ncbi:lipopolysaccharide biosynthesis protein [Micromonospora sp. HM5-17]|jgi:O-antigen/teichoic acid export membrane protein|uniref:lipopolysaccharide biosynthesis protein n=1 Tax=Micromonospora sp. HM5-17 TaxID=2487710 RepID=UPI000F46E429|nr:oligosaccharide flippase family protein [Micromonospora sp. HM5-17]ROT33173.1 lipopolysaccharide biosynthesis protein [Micromonospora sp. HM5-17]
MRGSGQETVERRTSPTDDPPARTLPGGADGRVVPDRSRRLASGIVTAVLSRGTGVLIPLVLVPVTLSYLGADLYGLWMAVTALTGMVAFADLGLGNGLMTKLAPCYASGDTEKARRYISSAYLVLVTVSLGICVLLWLVSTVVPWASLLNATATADPADARAVALVCLTGFVLNIPLSLVIRVQYAYQQVGRSNIWQAAGSLAALPLALGAVHAELPPVTVIAATILGPLLVNLLNTGWMYLREMRPIAPRLGAVDPALARELLRLSGLFFVLTIVWSVALNADSLVVAHALGLEAVTTYAVPARVFNLLGFLVTLVNLPLWSANGDALARGHLGWVRRTTRRMTLFSAFAALVPAVVLVLAGDGLFAHWLPVPIGVDGWLLAGLGLWMVALAATSPWAMVQNAAGVVRPQLLGVSCYLVLSTVGKWYAAKWYGVAAVPYVSVVGYGLTVVPCTLYGYRRALAVNASPASPTAAARGGDVPTRLAEGLSG